MMARYHAQTRGLELQNVKDFAGSDQEETDLCSSGIPESPYLLKRGQGA